MPMPGRRGFAIGVPAQPRSGVALSNHAIMLALRGDAGAQGAMFAFETPFSPDAPVSEVVAETIPRRATA
jgi:hypothetical protein